MTYELAKELKNAGYHFTEVLNVMPAHYSVAYVSFPPDEKLYREPTLEAGWASCAHDDALVIHQIGEGTTPAEAVARLCETWARPTHPVAPPAQRSCWLALNKPNTTGEASS